MRTTTRDDSPTAHGVTSDFEALFARYAAPIYRFSLRLCRNPADAEDLAQDVFVAAFLGRSRFEGRASLSTYLYRITVFRWRAMREKAARATPATSALDEQRTTGTTPDIAATTVERVSLDAALSALDDRHRAAFLLVKVEGLTCREASLILGIPEGTVKYHIHCAVRQLQKALADEEYADALRQHATEQRREITPTPKDTTPAETCVRGGLP